MQGGKRVGAGRKRGVQNKVNAALREKLNAGGLLPLELMLLVMRDERQDFAVRLETAKAAAPYLHPRLQAVEHTGDENNATRRWVVEIVPCPKQINNAPSCESLPPNGPASLAQASSNPYAEGITTLENGKITSSGRRWPV